jgi:predicted dehydrogenase
LVRLGIIGAGIMGERLLRAAQGAANVQISGMWDPAEATLARLAAELPGTPPAASAAEVIAGCDCVYVASPPATHLQHARAALAAGRALFCEKPLATDVADAAAFLAEAAGARAAVNFPFASSPAVERLAAWLPDLGKPDQVSIAVAFATWPRGWQHAAASWLDGPAQGGFTREVVSHFLFLARRLLGPLTLVSATAQFPDPGRSERAIEARLLAGALPISLTGSVGTTTEDDSNSFTLTSPAGAIRLRNWAFAERLDGDTWHGDPYAIPHAEARPLVLQRQLDGVARMTHGEPHGLATLAEAFEVQTLVEAILQSRHARA